MCQPNSQTSSSGIKSEHVVTGILYIDYSQGGHQPHGYTGSQKISPGKDLKINVQGQCFIFKRRRRCGSFSWPIKNKLGMSCIKDNDCGWK